MTEEQSINIDSRKLFNLGVNLLVAGFIRQKPEDAKKLFKELKQGVQISSGQLTSEQTGMVIPIKLELDRSEYRGQFNFPNFEISVKTMLQKFETEVRKDKELKDLHTLTNETTGGLLFNVPTGVKIGEDINVLMMAVEPAGESLVVKLMFMNPEQFQS
ncbi:hypothetical protein N8708_00355 [Porticoccaceae bacterium]|jgi:hypothetical protein|nr:hypothetical protein [Porticoccaceae bacterium]MBT6780011.1 hypothetical protein [Porticoccaceae bacterium]MDA7588451.1 hypothetical protein [Porticoccaceae bacterium]MDB3884406.1 hypothetical protein [Porticoccaceae bacterium]MDC3200683.1 hypothetical protein [Porticoccaceae bacterium]